MLQFPACLPLGPNGVLVKFSLHPDPTAMHAAQSLGARLREVGLPGVLETAVSLVSVLIRFDPAKTTRAQITDHLNTLLSERDWTRAQPPAAARRWLIPTVFGGDFGPGLSEAAQMAGLDQDDAISDLTGRDLNVLAIGFAPGQPYLGLLDERWNLPRLADLTPRVPAGAVVVAVRQVVLFANPSPTGWRHVGQTAFRPFDRTSDTPFALAAGDALRLYPVSPEDFTALSRDPLGGARCEVLQ